jgi:hypothetical protein
MNGRKVMNTKRLVATSLAAVGLVTASGLTSMAHAVDPPQRWGFVWADKATTASYTPDTTFQANSTGQVNTITRTALGKYKVNFKGLATPVVGGLASGTAQVTAYGVTNGRHCNVQNWSNSGANLKLKVACWKPNGAAVDQTFVANFYFGTHDNWDPGSQGGTLAYVATSSPTAPQAVAGRTHATLNNAITTSRISAGMYQVRIAGAASEAQFHGGTVKITSMGSGARRCKSAGWGPSGSDIILSVRCHSGTTMADAKFSAIYLLGVSMTGDQTGDRAYGWISNATAPEALGRFAMNQVGNTNQPISVTRTGVGNYNVVFSGQDSSESYVQATALGLNPAHCTVYSWGTTTPSLGVNVRCFSGSGQTPADSEFTVQFGH